MTRRELCRELRRVHRRSLGAVAVRPDPDTIAAQLADAEADLGFPLPKLLRTVAALAGPDFVNLDFAVAHYQGWHKPDRRPGDIGYWPPQMLPVRDLGNEIDWLCVDCTAGAGAVYVYYDDWDAGGPCWPGLFEPVAGSFEDFLHGFLATGEFPPPRANPDDPAGRPWTEYPGDDGSP